MKIIVTGGAGFIGSHLCEKLLSLGNEVVCIDNLCDFYDPTIKRTNLNNSLNNSNYTFYENDIRDLAVMDRIISTEMPDMIVHLAAMAGVRPSIQNPQLYYDVNVQGTLNLLELCKKYEIRKFVFASSSSVYGNNPKTPFSEEDFVDNPISPYAATKKAGELLCHTYYHLYQISTACLRFFTVYGPRQRPDLAIHKFSALISSDSPIEFYGDGSTRRDYTYVDDIIHGILQTMEFVQKGLVFEVFNLGESQTTTLSELLEQLETLLGKKAIRINLPQQAGDVNITYADISKCRRMLNYQPTTKIREGLGKFVEWFQGK